MTIITQSLKNDIYLYPVYFVFLQSAFELGASAEAVGVYKILIGSSIGDTGMGLCGVLSSSLILVESYLQTSRELDQIRVI